MFEHKQWDIFYSGIVGKNMYCDLAASSMLLQASKDYSSHYSEVL